jgi:hypothetical protein
MTKTNKNEAELATHVLDQKSARVIALGVMAAMIGTLAYIHRDDLAGAGTVAADGPPSALAACLEERLAAVDQMIADGMVGPEKASLFKDRARALCHSQNPE